MSLWACPTCGRLYPFGVFTCPTCGATLEFVHHIATGENMPPRAEQPQPSKEMITAGALALAGYDRTTDTPQEGALMVWLAMEGAK